MLNVNIKAIMKSILKKVIEHLSEGCCFSRHLFFSNHKMFASNEGELRRHGVHVLMHTQRKSLRGVGLMIINEASRTIHALKYGPVVSFLHVHD